MHSVLVAVSGLGERRREKGPDPSTVTPRQATGVNCRNDGMEAAQWSPTAPG